MSLTRKIAPMDACHELSMEGFEKLAREIMALGYDEETASHYAALIGDTPAVDDAGQVVVLDEHGQELARLALNFFER